MIEVNYLRHMGEDLDVVNAARVSFNKQSEEFSDRDEKLVGFLAREKHISPFGHCFASFHVKAPVFVARQLVKHKFLRWNEISRRYVDEPPTFYAPTEWRGRSPDKKQGSAGVIDVDIQTDIADFNRYCADYYEHLLAEGVAPEQARMVLPQSMYTEWHWSGSLDAFSDMCRLRCAPDTQAETREVANQIAEAMAQLFPVSWKALQGET